MKKFFLIVLLTATIISCKKDTDNPGSGGPQIPPPPPSPTGATVAVTAVGQTTGQKVEKTIGAAGGTITSADGKTNLVIPAGALETNQTISLQPIENKAPSGIGGFAYRFLPHGLQFKKAISLVLNYTNEEMAGSAIDALGMATQNANGTWKKTGNVSVNKNTKRLTAELLHFSDYSIYTSYALSSPGIESDTAVLHVKTDQPVRFVVTQEVELEDGLSIPMPSLSDIISWSVNGVENPSPLNNIGWIGGYGNNPAMCFRQYMAPRRAPASPSVTVSVKIDLRSMGQLFILRNVLIEDINSFFLNGKTYDNAEPSAIIVDAGGGLLSFGMLAKVGNKTAGVGLSIENFNGTAATYQFTGSEKVLITAHDEHGGHWASEKTHLGIIIYTGSVEITVSGTAPNRYLTGKITGTLFGASGTEPSAPINAVFGVRGF